MHRIHSVALAAGFVAAVGLGTTTAQTPQSEPKPTPQTMAKEKATQPEKAMNPDAEFAQKSAMGGKHEVESAKFAAGKAQNAELKALANRLVKDHTAVNTELSSLMKNKKITTGSEMKKDDAASESWRSLTGAAFDRAFTDHMIQAHEKSIANFEAESTSGMDPELKAFATKTLPTIKDHLKALQDVQKKLSTTT